MIERQRACSSRGGGRLLPQALCRLPGTGHPASQEGRNPLISRGAGNSADPRGFPLIPTEGPSSLAGKGLRPVCSLFHVSRDVKLFYEGLTLFQGIPLSLQSRGPPWVAVHTIPRLPRKTLLQTKLPSPSHHLHATKSTPIPDGILGVPGVFHRLHGMCRGRRHVPSRAQALEGGRWVPKPDLRGPPAAESSSPGRETQAALLVMTR